MNITSLNQRVANDRALKGKCPMDNCQSTPIDVDYGEMTIDGSVCVQKATCSDCGATWYEYYRWEGIDRLEQPEGIEVVFARSQISSANFSSVDWETEPLDYGQFLIKEIKDRFKNLRDQSQQPVIQEETEGNLRLISAAPKLFAACVKARDMINELINGDDSEITDLLDEVILKVRGET